MNVCVVFGASVNVWSSLATGYGATYCGIGPWVTGFGWAACVGYDALISGVLAFVVYRLAGIVEEDPTLSE